MAEARAYELVFIARPDIDQEGLDGLVKQVTDWVAAGGGEVVSVNHWGKRRLAYPIKRLGEGQYVLVRLSGKPEQVRTLEQNLLLQESVIRHLIVRTD
ncbi:MAG: 30S ribosomal protein S6 [Chloroflexota bacterium]|nr:30S ribosomal protein S6 [Chloroflexota bacterium]